MVNMDGQERQPLIRRGSFKCAGKLEMVMVLVFDLAFLAAVIVCFFAFDVWGSFGEPDGETRVLFFTIAVVISGTVCVTANAFVMNGRTYEYAAEEKEFTIKAPDGKTEYFYYDDVKDIRHEPFRLHGRVRGYIISIETGVRTVEYRYIFGDNKLMKGINDTPFYFLAVNSGLVQHEEKPSGITAEQIAAMYVRKGVQQMIEEEEIQRMSYFD